MRIVDAIDIAGSRLAPAFVLSKPEAVALAAAAAKKGRTDERCVWADPAERELIATDLAAAVRLHDAGPPVVGEAFHIDARELKRLLTKAKAKDIIVLAEHAGCAVAAALQIDGDIDVDGVGHSLRAGAPIVRASLNDDASWDHEDLHKLFAGDHEVGASSYCWTAAYAEVMYRVVKAAAGGRAVTTHASTSDGPFMVEVLPDTVDLANRWQILVSTTCADPASR